MRFALVMLAGLVGCYAPSTPANVACGAEGACPHGQHCRDGYCRDDSPGLDASGNAEDALAQIDAPAPRPECTGGDDVCLVSCVGSDPDCATTCGDGRCVGNAGELCGACPADCATTEPVCGNAACEPGEAPDCFADCGPTPWTWAAEETTLLGLLNDARASGFECPDGPSPLPVPMLVLDPSMLPAAREWAWEIAHHAFYSNGGAACNGRSYSQRRAQGGFQGYVSNRNASTVQAVFDSWMAEPELCELLTSTLPTKAAVAVAADAQRGYILLLK